MNDLAYIDDYFGGRLTENDNRLFDERIVSDPVFAKQVAFYLNAIKAAALADHAEHRELHKDWLTERSDFVQHRPAPLRRMVWFSAAATVLIACLLWFLFQRQDTSKMASAYIQSHYATLPVNMGVNQDSLQSAVAIYNEGRPEEAAHLFEILHAQDSTDWQTLQYLGIAKLRLKQYDAAINAFTMLENQQQLHTNRGMFLHALALLERNQQGDIDTARKLLNTVVARGLQGEADAREILRGL